MSISHYHFQEKIALALLDEPSISGQQGIQEGQDQIQLLQMILLVNAERLKYNHWYHWQE